MEIPKTFCDKNIHNYKACQKWLKCLFILVLEFWTALQSYRYSAVLDFEKSAREGLISDVNLLNWGYQDSWCAVRIHSETRLLPVRY